MFQRIVEASLQQRLLVLAAAAALLVFGLLQLRGLPVDVLPELARPTVSVQVEAPGLAPEEIEALIAFPLEAALAGLPQLQRLRSASTPGLALVTAEFDWGVDLYRQRQLVTERIEAARAQLPPGVQPRLGPVTSLMGEVMLIGLRSPQDGATPAQLREWADWVARPALLALPGVSQVLTIGGELRQYEIQPDPQRMRLLGVSLAQIEQAARGFGGNGGAGLVDSQGGEVLLRTVGRPLQLDALRQLAVSWRDDAAAPVRLSQVADVVEGRRLKRGDAGVDGVPAVILSLHKQPGADTLALTDAVERRLDGLRASLPGDARCAPVFRQADFIRASVGNLRDALLHASAIATLVLLLFLGSGRATLAAAAAIPLSLVAALLLLRAFGLPVDTMTLGGIAIAVGELVDDAVVGVENVVRRLRENRALEAPRPALQVVAQATAEVRSGILYATLVIVLAIAPLLALGGVEGRLFAPLAFAYIAAILASLLVAVTVTPVLCLLGLGRPQQLPRAPAWIARVQDAYGRRLSAVLDRPRGLLALAALLLLGSAAALAWLPRSFLPPFNERSLTVNLLLEPGIALAESQRLALAAERLLLGVPGVQQVAHRSGRAEADEHAEGVHYTEFEVLLHRDARDRDALVAQLQAQLAPLPGSVSVGQPISHRLDHVLSGVRAPLAVKLVGDDLAELRRLAAELGARLRADARLGGVQVEKQGEVAQWQARIDPARAGAYGLSPPRVQETLARLGAGEVLAPVLEGERRFDLVLRLAPSAREPGNLQELLLDAPAGPVPLSWIADFEQTTGPNQILREQLRRRLVVSAFPSGELAEGAAAVEAAVAAMRLPPGFELRVEGEWQAQREALRRLLLLGLLSLLLMAAVIHARYRRLRLSLIVLAAVPLSAVGGLAALLLAGLPLSVASGVGFVTLSGIAVRNTILKLSHALNLAAGDARGLHRELLLRAARERLLPVAMTALVAALALAPLLWPADAPGREILHPVAVVLFGGLLAATLLDSFLTPLLIERYARPGPQQELRADAAPY